MSLGKQAKILTEKQVQITMAYLSTTRHAKRDKAMFMLSVRAGLRACEIARVKWGMVMDAEGALSDHLALPDDITKKNSGRIIPLHPDLSEALQALLDRYGFEPDDWILQSERGGGLTAGTVQIWFKRLYRTLNFQGCSSHSGRRTFITEAGRTAPKFGSSTRDVQLLAGHKSLANTQRYIDGDPIAQKSLVTGMFRPV